MKNVLIAGYGQIGKSIEGLYKGFKDTYNIYIKDITSTHQEPQGVISVDVLHICIPFLKDFNTIVKDYVSTYNPVVTIIHSTVDVTTTRELCEQTGENIVHSPVMGKHPNLTESIQTFKKIIGGNNQYSVDVAVGHFEELGVDCVVFRNSDESEAAKLLDTTYYGWNILYMKHVHKFCKDRNLDFDNVYTTTNEIYNDGYKHMGNEEFTRPVLKYQAGKIGGHCVRPNFEILEKTFYPAKLGIEMDEDESL